MGLLQIVHLETNDADAELVCAELQNGGIACEVLRVRNESELRRELAQRPVDIILSDRLRPGRAMGCARSRSGGRRVRRCR